MKKKCIDCGTNIVGRSDKKFCSDMCRNAYHNKYNGFRNAMIRHVNHKLRKNRHILAELYRQNDLEMKRETLVFMGFDTQYFTEEQIRPDGIFRFCYDFGLETLEDERVRILTRSGLRHTKKSDSCMSIAAESPEIYLPDTSIPETESL